MGLGVIALGVMIALTMRMSWIKQEMIETESEIISIERYGDDNNEVMISYVYENMTYTAKSSFYSSSMRIGDYITIYIDPTNPAKIYQVDRFFYTFFPGIFAFVFLAIGTPTFLHAFKTSRLRKRLMENGKKVIGTIVEVHTNYRSTMTINNRRYHKTTITCRLDEDYSLIERTFKSRFWTPQEMLIQPNESDVDIWVDTENPNIYFVDTDNIRNKSVY